MKFPLRSLIAAAWRAWFPEYVEPQRPNKNAQITGEEYKSAPQWYACANAADPLACYRKRQAALMRKKEIKDAAFYAARVDKMREDKGLAPLH